VLDFEELRARSRTKVWGAHSSPGVVHGGLAGHKARIRFDEVTIIIAKPLRRLRPHLLKVLAGGDAGQLHARARVLVRP
jgi:hypothetical protein